MDFGAMLNDSGIVGGGQNPTPGSESSVLGHNPNSHQEEESNYGFNNQSNNMQDNLAAQQHITQDNIVAQQHIVQDRMVAQQHIAQDRMVAQQHITQDNLAAQQHITQDNLAAQQYMNPNEEV